MAIVRMDTTRIVEPGHATDLAALESQVLTVVYDLECELQQLCDCTANTRIKNGIYSGPLDSWQLPATTARQMRNRTYDLW